MNSWHSLRWLERSDKETRREGNNEAHNSTPINILWSQMIGTTGSTLILSSHRVIVALRHCVELGWATSEGRS
jgi:hypothetical protein